MRVLKPSEVEVRIGTVGKNGVTLLLYKNARVDMQILDETFGSFGWQRDHKEIKGNLYCGIGVWSCDVDGWVWKWDCGTESNTEKEKGEASDSFKRAGFCWGIGRELYNSPFIFVPVPTEEYTKGKYKLRDPKVLYGIYVSDMKVIEENGVKKVDSLDISRSTRNGTYIIWSTDKRKEGMRI